MYRIMQFQVVTLFVVLIGCATTDESQTPSDKLVSKSPGNSPNSTLSPTPVIQVGRYSAMIAVPTEAQTNPLRVIISVTLPREVVTVRQGVEYLLRRSGYRLQFSDQSNTDVADLYHYPLPQVHRQLGPMPLDDALRTLAGSAFELDVDPVHRTIAYRRAQPEPLHDSRIEVAYE